jgi:hypothetical protein
MSTRDSNKPPGEIEPPWVKHPEYPPGDTFWRQAGEAYFIRVWRPYWDSLDAAAQRNYLERWSVPEVWRRFYFDEEFTKWLDSVDDD